MVKTMHMKLNSKEIKELREEVITDVLKQQIRASIDDAFTRELRKEVVEKIKKRVDAYSISGLMDKAIKEEVHTLVPLLNLAKVQAQLVVELKKKINITKVAKQIEESAEMHTLNSVRDNLNKLNLLKEL